MLQITPALQIDENELRFEFVRASGPGGQNVNKVATAVQLRFDISNSPSLASDVKGRLIRLAGSKVNVDGIMLIEGKRFRTQEANREDVIHRFVELVRKSVVPPKPRKKTKPTTASKEKRLKEKKQRGEIKKYRQSKKFE